MLISCVICSDLLVAADDVSVTPCGHLFHYICLTTWMERSKSCPHCRAKATEKTIHRIFFTVSNQDGIEDNSSLQNKVDSLSFEVRMKSKDLQNAREKMELCQSQVIGLKGEIKDLEDKISTQLTTISAFKTQIKFLQQENVQAKRTTNDYEVLRQEVNKYKSIQSVINGTANEVEELVQNYQVSGDSIKSLGTFVVILKKQLISTTDKRKNLRNLLRTTEIDLSKIITERNELQRTVKASNDVTKHLEEDVKHLENAKKQLHKQVEALEKAIISPSSENPRDRALRRLISESPAPELKRPRLTDPADFGENVFLESPRPSTLDPGVKVPVTTPYLKIKSSNIGLTPLRTKPNTSNFNQPKNNLSIFKNSRRPAPSKSFSGASQIQYDGLGGHSKADDFPKPISLGNALKKSKSTSTTYKIKNSQIPTHTNTLKLENYFDLA